MIMSRESTLAKPPSCPKNGDHLWVTFQVLYVFFVIHHTRGGVVHVGVIYLGC